MGSSKNLVRHFWKHFGVGNSVCDANHCRIQANIASMSSWLWPELRNDNVAPLSFPRAISPAKRRSCPSFFTSLLQLSAWRVKKTLLRSNFRESLVRPIARISLVRLELLEQVLGERARVTLCPWMIRLVEVSRGRLKDENSLARSFADRGHACLAASIESKIPVIWHGQRFLESNLLSALQFQ